MDAIQFWPQHRDERYPRHLGVDLRKLPLETSEKYVKAYGVPVRPDCTPQELQVAAGRHFEAHLDVDEEESILRFWNALKRGSDGKRAVRGRTPVKVRQERRAVAVARVHEPEPPVSAGEESADDTPLYCICKRPDYGEMIACDNDGCAIEWFHLGCVGLTPTTRPAAHEAWYCPTCSAPMRARAKPRGGAGAGAGGAGGSKKKGAGGAGGRKRSRF